MTIQPGDEVTLRAHMWFQRFGLTCCKQCGLVQRADGKNRPCPGPVRLGLRNRIGADRFELGDDQ